jgi:ABC-type phosphate transport system auxiliary subunit
MSKVVKLTPSILRQIVLEEKARLSGKPVQTAKVAKETEEVAADDLAHSLAKEIDHYKGLREEAERLAQRLSKINEASQRLRSKILRKL